MQKTLKIPFLIGFSTALFTLASCNRSHDLGKGAPDLKAALQVQLGAEPATLDPARAEDGVALQVLANTMDGLYAYDGAGVLEPALAGTTQVSPDRKHYRFTLRPEARWSDGKPVLPEHFVMAFQRALDPKDPGKLAPNFDIIRGAAEYRAGKTEWKTVGVSVEGNALVIDLVEPITHFLDLLTLPSVAPVLSLKWDETGPTTGPYVLAHHILNQHILLDVNEECWRRMVKNQRPLRPVMMRIVPDENTGMSLFESGRLDILSRLPTTDLARAAKLGTLRRDPFYATYYLGINTRNGKVPVALRRAWDRAIAREPIVKALGTGDYPARTWIPAGIEGHEDWTGDLPPSVEHSGAKLRIEAGFDASARNQQILEIVQKQLEAVGVELTLSPLDWKSYLRRIDTDPPPIFRMGWLTPVRDPILHLQMLVTGGPNNLTGWSNKNYDRLVNEVRTMEPGAARVKKIHEAQKILSDEVPIIPLYHYSQTHLLSKRVENFRVNPFGVMRFEEIQVSGDPHKN